MNERHAQPVWRVTWIVRGLRFRRNFYSEIEAEAYRATLSFPSRLVNVDPFRNG